MSSKLIKFLICLIIAGSLCALHGEKLGYALSGGGARGFAHIGVLKVLEEEGIKPDYISGTSIGAIIGALYAMGYNANEIEEICLKLDWDSLTRDQHTRRELYIGQKRWTPFGNIFFELDDNWLPQLPSSVYVGNRINLELFRLFAAASQVQDFSELPIPFVCNATNLVTGEPKTFSSGSLVQALRASMSIPSLVQPFEIDGLTYIDGGVSQNLPIDLLHEQGADKVIAIKVNSTLRDRENLNNFVEVLDQTINIGITRNLNEHLNSADLILEPELCDIYATDYQEIPSIILSGERAAREQIEAIRAFKSNFSSLAASPTSFNKELDKFTISNFKFHGNVHVSPSKTYEYLGLKTGRTYSTKDIYIACANAWNSLAFSTIYPVLEPNTDGTYTLHIHVKERKRRNIALNMAYNSEDKLMASTVLSLNNSLLKNSKLLAEIKLGGRNELNLDYVKNFGEHWGVYYRLFPYLNEKTIYLYRDHQKTNSVKSLECGLNTGVGVFAKNLAIAEFFLFSSSTRLYSEIAETPMIPKNSIVSGFGIKAYHESLDNFYFPTKGMRFLSKFNFSRNKEISDFIYSSFQGRGELYFPVLHMLSVKFAMDTGSYFNSETTANLDPFVIGGAGGFMGYSRYELSAPHYQIISSGISVQPLRKLHLYAGGQVLRYSNSEIWGVQKSWENCYNIGLGFENAILPVRMFLAMNELKRLNTILSIGYDVDIFQFSRR